MKYIQLFTLLSALLTVSTTTQADGSLNSLSYMQGKWTVSSSFHEDGKWGAQSVPMRATADTVLGGSFLRVQAPVSFPGGTFQFELTLSYDRFHQLYRMAFLDDLNAYMDVYDGNAQNGIVSVTNANSGSGFPDGNGGIVIGRLDFEKTAEGFLITSYVASGKEGPFSPYMKLTFSPAS